MLPQLVDHSSAIRISLVRPEKEVLREDLDLDLYLDATPEISRHIQILVLVKVSICFVEVATLSIDVDKVKFVLVDRRFLFLPQL